MYFLIIHTGLVRAADLGVVVPGAGIGGATWEKLTKQCFETRMGQLDRATNRPFLVFVGLSTLGKGS
jgi:hypothetical protein